MRRAWPLWLFIASVPLYGSDGSVRACTPDELRRQLLDAKTVVAACAASGSASACDRSGIGPDAKVDLASGPRLVEFGWLRLALADAQKSNHAAALLANAEQRIDRELAELAASNSLAPAQLKEEQTKLRKILASGAFPQSQPETLWARMWNHLSRWLQQVLRRPPGASNTDWISQILMLALLGSAGGGLIWWLSRIRRTQRLLLTKSVADRTPSGSVRPEWELWLEQARQLAQEQHWREAIHRVYWAAIARMESRGIWRPDPARTPREYLNLIDRQNALRTDLAQLTEALEQFWYGGRSAAERDYTDACRSLDRLCAS